MKKRLGALLCALVMCLALLSPASALEEVCFTSLNNKLLPLASDTMPLWSGGVLYVPASLFDGSATNASYGVTLGVSLTQSQSSGTITLYSLSGILVFDLNSGICVDQQTGELLSGRAITRNGRIYLPLNIVVDFFRAAELLSPHRLRLSGPHQEPGRHRLQRAALHPHRRCLHRLGRQPDEPPAEGVPKEPAPCGGTRDP